MCRPIQEVNEMHVLLLNDATVSLSFIGRRRRSDALVAFMNYQSEKLEGVSQIYYARRCVTEQSIVKQLHWNMIRLKLS